MDASPPVDYALSGDLHIAYQAVGDGPIDVVFLPAWYSHLELIWQGPRMEAILRRFSGIGRLILFDQRGTGMSDPVSLHELPTLEERADDVRAVMDAVGSERAAIIGFVLGGPLAAYFAASHPDRTSALVLFNTSARPRRGDDQGFGYTDGQLEEGVNRILAGWGRDVPENPIGRATLGRHGFPALYQRMSMAPGAAAALARMNLTMDVRNVLETIRVPALVMHRRDNPQLSADHGRFLAAQIPDARYVELPGDDTLWFNDDPLPVLDEIEEFLTGVRPAPEPDRVLATVMFSDIVSSTQRASEVGDRVWKDLLLEHEAAVRRSVNRYHGRVVKNTGDGVMATFDGPARAIRCALEIRSGVSHLGLEVRAGLHTGEVELLGDDIAGIAAHIGSRVTDLAGPDEVLVSSTVKDLVVGSGIVFEDRGSHTLKGVSDEWRIFAVTG
jgi:class 3 adenylate cyclase